MDGMSNPRPDPVPDLSDPGPVPAGEGVDLTPPPPPGTAKRTMMTAITQGAEISVGSVIVGLQSLLAFAAIRWDAFTVEELAVLEPLTAVGGVVVFMLWKKWGLPLLSVLVLTLALFLPW